jgi:hypothetical protein
MLEKFIVQIGADFGPDSRKTLEDYLRFVITNVLDHKKELAVKIINHNTAFPKHYLSEILEDAFPVILIGGASLPTTGRENSYFNGYKPWKTFSSAKEEENLNDAITHIKEIFTKKEEDWEKQLYLKHGSGYDTAFTKSDGSVGMGYELRMCGGTQVWIALSLVHVHYFK